MEEPVGVTSRDVGILCTYNPNYMQLTSTLAVLHISALCFQSAGLAVLDEVYYQVITMAGAHELLSSH